MFGIARYLPRIVEPRLDMEMLKALIIFCDFGLISSPVFLSYGPKLGT
ncbi:MAG TPA: hypothetical protein VMU69_00350 [Bradyrhizobium sp.]|nr:hypothetical protein [Bradyrhizobium sp.]